MKKIVLKLSAIALIVISFVYVGCKKPDNKAPVITLNGGANITISLQDTTYTELKATANDDKDGTLTPAISGTVNINHTGTYTITYTAIDAAGNIGTGIRTVIVKNDVDAMTGYYACSGSTTYNDTIKASETINNRIHFEKFGNYQGNTNIYVDITGINIVLDSILIAQVGNPAYDRAFQGIGLITSPTVFNLDYTETTNGIPSVKNEIFTKQ